MKIAIELSANAHSVLVLVVMASLLGCLDCMGRDWSRRRLARDEEPPVGITAYFSRGIVGKWSLGRQSSPCCSSGRRSWPRSTP